MNSTICHEIMFITKIEFFFEFCQEPLKHLKKKEQMQMQLRSVFGTTIFLPLLIFPSFYTELQSKILVSCVI